MQITPRSRYMDFSRFLMKKVVKMVIIPTVITPTIIFFIIFNVFLFFIWVPQKSRSPHSSPVPSRAPSTHSSPVPSTLGRNGYFRTQYPFLKNQEQSTHSSRFQKPQFLKQIQKYSKIGLPTDHLQIR